MSTIIITNNTASDVTIVDLRSFEMTASGTETLSDYFSNVEISNSDNLIGLVASEIFTVNNGIENLSPTTGVKYCLGKLFDVALPDEWRDRSGKLRVHQTSRRLGLGISWTGAGDDVSDITKVFRGEPLTFEFDTTTSGLGTLINYIDFNIVENETWLHEGYMTWKNCHFDKLTLKMVTRVTSMETASGTNYNLYGGYLVVPAAPGTGTINITSDITDPIGGLIYIPDDDLGNPPTAYWNADWNSSTKHYENITPAYTGNGRYNMFVAEVTLAEFASQIPLLSNGFIVLNSSDTDQMGQGMRLKMILEPGDHNGSEEIVGIACILCLHREKNY